MLLEACLGMKVCAADRTLTFRNPFLPAFLQEIRVKNLAVGDAVVDISFRRREEDSDVSINVKPRHGEVDVTVLKSKSADKQ